MRAGKSAPDTLKELLAKDEGREVRQVAMIDAQGRVLVTGTARTQLVGECTRCLDPLGDVIAVDLQELFTYDDGDFYVRNASIRSVGSALSAFGSASSSVHGNDSGNGRPNTKPKYPDSVLAVCFTRPSRLVPVGVIGVRT